MLQEVTLCLCLSLCVLLSSATPPLNVERPVDIVESLQECGHHDCVLSSDSHMSQPYATRLCAIAAKSPGARGVCHRTAIVHQEIHVQDAASSVSWSLDL